MNGKSGGKELDKLQSQSLVLYKKVLELFFVGECNTFERIIFFRHL